MQTEPEKQKRCSKCKEEKALTEFSKNKSAKDGLQNNCRACVKAYNAKYYEANRDERRRYYAKRYRANREEKREYMAKYYEANRDERLEYRAKYYAANRDKYRELNANYQKANPEKIRAIRQRRRARKANAQGTHTADQWEERLAYHGYKCIYCGVEKQDTPQKYLTMEHLIPLCRGGSNWPSNLAPSCTSCNCSKGPKTHFEYLEYLDGQKEV